MNNSIITQNQHDVQNYDQETNLEERMNKLWERFDYLSDEFNRQLGSRDLPQTVTIIDVSNAEMSAIDAQQAYYRHVYEANECECNSPFSTPCRVCRAQASMRSEYRI